MWKSRSSEALVTILIVLLIIIVVAIMWNFASALMCQTRENMGELADVVPDSTTNAPSNQPATNAPRDMPADKPKFVVYHWENCGHCKHIMDGGEASVFSQVAAKYPNVDCLSFKVGYDEEAAIYNAFPVIKFIALKNQKPFVVEYNGGDRSVEGLSQFINASISALKKQD